MFLIETQGNMITSKVFSPSKTKDQIEVAELFFNSIKVPSTFDLSTNGEYINVVPVQPPPEPPQPKTEMELLREQQARIDADMAAFMDYVLGGM